MAKSGHPIYRPAQALFLPGGLLLMGQSVLIGGRRVQPMVLVPPNPALAWALHHRARRVRPRSSGPWAGIEGAVRTMGAFPDRAVRPRRAAQAPGLIVRLRGGGRRLPLGWAMFALFSPLGGLWAQRLLRIG
ncbi:MAG TPA: hypothetical protein VF533_10660 [Solirubrobacteraceae bacterium]|jgi:hypothetical protein